LNSLFPAEVVEPAMLCSVSRLISSDLPTHESVLMLALESRSSAGLFERIGLPAIG
jgi:hypothetical protein